MIINISGGGEGKTNIKIIRIVASNTQQLTLPYTVTLGFKPTWITSSGYQNTSGGGHTSGEINQNNSRTFNNSSSSSNPYIYEPYAITNITEDGFQFIKNPTFSSSSYTSFYGNMIITAGDEKTVEISNLP